MPGSTVPRAAATETGPAETRRLSRSARAALAACLLVSGAAALVYEVLWLRQLGLVMGDTAYALSTVLTAFLGGLALGAYAGGRWARRGLASPMLSAGIEVAIAAAALAMPWLISGLDPLFGVAYRGLFNRFLAYNLVQFASCGAVLVLPTFLMGTTLPIVAALVVDEENDVGAGTGLLYAINSLGGVIGAGLAGFALLPAMGMLATSRVAAALNVGAAALAFAVARRGAVAEPAPARSAPAGSSAAGAGARRAPLRGLGLRGARPRGGMGAPRRALDRLDDVRVHDDARHLHRGPRAREPRRAAHPAARAEPGAHPLRAARRRRDLDAAVGLVPRRPPGPRPRAPRHEGPHLQPLARRRARAGAALDR